MRRTVEGVDIYETLKLTLSLTFTLGLLKAQKESMREKKETRKKKK